MSSVFSAAETEDSSRPLGHLPSQISRMTSTMSQLSCMPSVMSQMSRMPSTLSHTSLQHFSTSCVPDDESLIPLGCTPSAFGHRRLQHSAFSMQPPLLRTSGTATAQLDRHANGSSLPVEHVPSVPGQQSPQHPASSCKPTWLNTPEAARAALAATCSGLRITTEVGRSELRPSITCLCCKSSGGDTRHCRCLVTRFAHGAVLIIKHQV